jgi:hypothetical protein
MPLVPGRNHNGFDPFIRQQQAKKESYANAAGSANSAPQILNFKHAVGIN